MPVESIDQVSVYAVEQRVKCELGDAYRHLATVKGAPNLDRWAAGLALTLSVDATGGVTPSTSLAGPYGSITPLEISAGASGNAKRTALLNVYMSFLEASRHKCSDPSPVPIENALGLSDWIVRTFKAQIKVNEEAIRVGSTLAGADLKNKDKSIGYSLDFLLTLSASATPNFVIPNATGKVLFGYESKSTHSIDVAMLEMDEDDFRTHFEPIKVQGHFVEKLVQNPGTSKKSLVRKRQYVEPKTVYRETTSGLGEFTKQRLEGVLLQLNNKVLIQSLRR